MFTDASGVGKGANVQMAGMTVGKVTGVHLDGDHVVASLSIDHGTQVPADSRAEVVLGTLLGDKAIRLVPGNDWTELLGDGDVIGLDHTSTQFDVIDLVQKGTPALADTDAAALNRVLDEVRQVTAGKQGDVKEVVDGLDRLTTLVDARQGETRDLIDQARRVATTLAARDADITTVLDDLDPVLASLSSRRRELGQLLKTTADTAAQFADLVARNRPELEAVLTQIHQDLGVLSRHQLDIAESLALLPATLRNFGNVARSGPDYYPNRWVNIYGQVIGPVDYDSLYGACGLLDKVLDIAIGPDPLPCSQRTGPLVGQTVPQAEGAATAAGGSLESQGDSYSFALDPGPGLQGAGTTGTPS
jgi:phospholipid/cholesterol/gamma-HCH transport system substrate-binding protein